MLRVRYFFALSGALVNSLKGMAVEGGRGGDIRWGMIPRGMEVLWGGRRRSCRNTAGMTPATNAWLPSLQMTSFPLKMLMMM